MVRLDIFDNPQPGLPADLVRIHRAERIELACHAEAVGFSGIFVTEHPAAVGGAVPSALIECAVLGRATTTLQVGTAGIISTVRHPGAVAEEIAQVASVVGPERLIAGLAKGFQRCVFTARNLAMPTTADYIAGVGAVVDHLAAVDVAVPVMASSSAATKTGTWLMSNPYGRGCAELFADEVACYRSAGGTEVFAHVLVHVDTDTDRARAIGRPAIQRYLDAHGSGAAVADLEAAGLVVVGDVPFVADALSRITAVGVTRLGLNPVLGYLEPADAHIVVQLLGTEVSTVMGAAGAHDAQLTGHPITTGPPRGTSP